MLMFWRWRGTAVIDEIATLMLTDSGGKLEDEEDLSEARLRVLRLPRSPASGL